MTKPCVALLLGTALLVGSGNAAAQAEGPQEARRWTPATLFPPGALLAVVSADPALPGETTAELSLPDGYRVPRHFHPMQERLEVRHGTLLVSIGGAADVERTDTLHAGDTAYHPQGGRHYYVARGPRPVTVAESAAPRGSVPLSVRCYALPGRREPASERDRSGRAQA